MTHYVTEQEYQEIRENIMTGILENWARIDTNRLKYDSVDPKVKMLLALKNTLEIMSKDGVAIGTEENLRRADIMKADEDTYYWSWSADDEAKKLLNGGRNEDETLRAIDEELLMTMQDFNDWLERRGEGYLFSRDVYHNPSFSLFLLEQYGSNIEGD